MDYLYILLLMHIKMGKYGLKNGENNEILRMRPLKGEMNSNEIVFQLMHNFLIGDVDVKNIENIESSFDIESEDLEIDLNILREIKALGVNFLTMTYSKFLSFFKDLSSFSINFNILNEIKSLGVDFSSMTINEFISLIAYHLDLDIKKITKLKNSGFIVCYRNIIELNKMCLDKINYVKLKKYNGYYGIEFFNLKQLDESEILSDEELLLCKQLGITNYNDVKFFCLCLRNFNKEVVKSFVRRKKEYYKNNQILSLGSFELLFGGSGKYGKTEINQSGLGLCYAYTFFELLKITGLFDELIQTNMRENGSGREVRLPFCDREGKWISVSKDEIDKSFVINKFGKERKICINSKSDFLGFKILEVAFIKKMIIDGRGRDLTISPYEAKKQALQEYEKRGDITINGLLLGCIEGGSIGLALSIILPKNYVILHDNINGLSDDLKNHIFNLFSSGLFKVSLSLNENLFRFSDKKILKKRLNYDGEELNVILLKNAKIVNKSGERIISRYIIDETGSLKDDISEIAGDFCMPDFVLNENRVKNVIIFPNHVYCLEKCYLCEDTGEKRVWIVNPRHTGIKIDISLDECKKIFNWELFGLDLDNMFCM